MPPTIIIRDNHNTASRLKHGWAMNVFFTLTID
jgi:hypothetical protein